MQCELANVSQIDPERLQRCATVDAIFRWHQLRASALVLAEAGSEAEVKAKADSEVEVESHNEIWALLR